MERHQQGNAQARGFHAQKQEGVQGAAHGEIEEDSLVIACSHRQECNEEQAHQGNHFNVEDNFAILTCSRADWESDSQVILAHLRC